MNAEHPSHIWSAALGELQMQMTQATYDTWLRDSRLMKYEDNTFVVAVRNGYAKDWLEHRLQSPIKRTLARLSGQPVDIKFVVWTEDIKPPESTSLLNLPASKASPPTIAAPTVANLNPRYTFDNFVVGPNNRLAHAASVAVAENPADAYNPLFIYGGVGLGKTHLMNAIGNFIRANDPQANVLFITSETFTNELIDAIVKKKGTAELRNKMRNVDVLLVDDIQFLSKTVATQEEFFHTFNDLHTKGKQIIVSSDRSPKDLSAIEERLRSRFEWGLPVDVQKPDFETRVAILRRKADDEEIDTPTEVLEYIAERVESNIRELEGALTRVNAQSQLMGKPIALEMARETLSSLLSTREARKITAESIIQLVSSHFSVGEDEVVGKRRSREVALPRQVSMYMLRELTPLSTTAIGRVFKRDHSTVMHACDKIAGTMKTDIRFRKTVEELIEFAKRR